MMTRMTRAMVAIAVLGIAFPACKRPMHGGESPSGGGPGGPPTGGGRNGGFVTTPIAFAKISNACVSLKEETVRARSEDSVVWAVIAQESCGFEDQTVEIRFLDGRDPGKCECSATIRRNAAKVRLIVKKHAAHESYGYEIRVNGKPVSDPRLEVDP